MSRLRSLVQNPVLVAKHRLVKLSALSRSKTCYVCGASFGWFIPFKTGWRGVSPFLRKAELVGSDVDNFYCPKCGCHDRERHLAMYFDALNIWDRFRGADVLHFAPEQPLVERISARQPHKYVLADLNPPNPGVQRVDVTDTGLETESFDVLICNHVLEHVKDERSALSEIFRVLRPGAFAILQTPYSSFLSNTFQDQAICTDELREYYYSQNDHLRLFGRDLFSKLESVGFQLNTRTHSVDLANLDPVRYGVNHKEPLIMVTKPASH